MSARQRRQKENRRHRAEAQRRRLIAAGGLTVGATLAMSGVAKAATTYTVGTLDDPGSAVSDCTTATNTDCSLREAITEANANAGADIVVFRSGLSGTITLTNGHLDVSQALTITGPGSSQLTVDANYVSRIFDVDPVPATDPVSISGLTLTNGSVSGQAGGDIYNEDGPLTLSNMVISGGYATDTKQHGGGVYSHGGPLTIDHSTVSGNHAYYGGGVASYTGNVTITDSEVSNNYADGNTGSNGSDGYGGGVWSGGADLTITRSTIYDNTSAYDGGGIYAVDGSGSAVTISNSTIVDNHAANDDAGGVYDDGSYNSLTVIGSTVTGNTAATDGGGLKATSVGTRVIQNSIVSGNTSGSNPNTDDLETGQYFDTAFSLIGVPGGFVNETVPGSNLIGVDPQLSALGNNGGGPTETMVPANTSPVVNKGSAFGLTTDQRGLTRPVAFPGVANSSAAGADGSDIGAVELQASPAPVVPAPHKKKKCKKKKHKRSADSAKKKKCKKKKKK